MKYVIQVYRRYADFQGRARRMEFWSFTGFFLLVLTLITTLLRLGYSEPGSGISVVLAAVVTVFVIGSLVPSLAVRVRRLHDINRTGWWILISLLPLIGGLVLLVFSLLPGTQGKNRYGADPKASGDEVSEVFA